MSLTVLQAANKVTLSGNGVDTVFSLDPVVLQASGGVEVKHYSTADVETTLTEGTGASNYSIAAATSFPGTGSVTYPADKVTPMATGERVIVRRIVDLDQTTDLQNQAAYDPEVLEAQFDTLVMIDVQQGEVLDRAFKLPPEDATAINPEIPSFSGNANKYLRVDSDAGGVDWAAVSVASGAASDVTPVDVSLTAAAAGTAADVSREDHVHLLPTVSVAKGGTGAVTAAAARTALGVAALTDAEKAQHDVAYSLSTFAHGGF